MYQCPHIRTNAVVDVVLTVQADPAQAEPVTVAEAKEYLRISTSTDDSVIGHMITEAREWVEKRCGISILKKDVVAIVEVMNRQELPYGPIDKASISATNIEGVMVSNPVLTGLDGGYISIGGYGQFTVSYTAGMDIVPQDIKQAIKAAVAFSYENRGDELDKSNKPYAKEARMKSNHYRRTIGF